MGNVECVVWEEEGIEVVRVSREKLGEMLGCVVVRLIRIEDRGGVLWGEMRRKRMGVWGVVNVEEEFR